MYRALWDRRHEGATRISQCTRRRVHWRIRVAPECLRFHNARYIMLKSDYNMKYLVLIHYEAEIYRRSSEAGGGETCIVENLCMVFYQCHAMFVTANVQLYWLWNILRFPDYKRWNHLWDDYYLWNNFAIWENALREHKQHIWSSWKKPHNLRL